MHYLIDGHNLIARLPGISLDDPHDEAKLVLRLKSWAAASRKRHITIVFDGGIPGGMDSHLSSSQVRALFSPSGRRADAILINRIRAIRNPSEFTLVTSDREILAEASKRGVPYQLAEDFAQQLEDDPAVGVSRRPPEELPLSDEEVSEWLEIFGQTGKE